MKLVRCCLLIGLAIGFAPPAMGQVAPLSAPRPSSAREGISPDALHGHIEFLAHADRHGRGRLGSPAAADYLRDHFVKLGLKPLFGESYFQAIPGRVLGQGTDDAGGRNVGAILPGSDPQLQNEYVIIAAHYDHLGRRGEVFFPGADDNASGTSMLLETARVFAESEIKPRRSLIFVGFDLEERLLWGSRWFVGNSPVPLEQIKCVFVADMIGRSLAGLDLQTVFVLGSEHSPQLVQALDAVPVPDGLTAARLGIDLIGVRSDYGPFWNENIPFLFFSTGEHPDYHQPTDTAEKIRLPQVVAISELIHRLTSCVANADVAPVWTDDVSPSLEEVRAVQSIAEQLLANQNPARPFGTSQLLLLGHVKTQAAKILSRGTMSEGERSWLIRVSQLLIFSVL